LGGTPPSKGYPEERLRDSYPRTYEYLLRFEDELRNRSGYKKYLEPYGNPFYSTYNVGPYTFSPYKVVWPNIASDIRAAVVSESDGRIVVPEHVVTLVPFEDASEAHYVCAVIGSSPANFVVQSYSTRGGKSFGTPHVLENVHIPHFKPTDSIHRQLAALSQQAHGATAVGDAVRVREIETEIDQLAIELWGLTQQELEDIQQSLEELR
jgi:hypothetical protein